MNRRDRARTLCAVFLQLTLTAGALAQGEPASRADVKAATKEAAAQRQLLPAGEGVSAGVLQLTRSTKTRAQRKAETLQAHKAGEIPPAGELGAAKADRAALSGHSGKTRGERKAETLAAAKAKQLIPAGEGLGTSRR